MNKSIEKDGRSPLITKVSDEKIFVPSIPADWLPHVLSKVIPSIISCSPPSADILKTISE